MGAFTYPRSEPGSGGHQDLIEQLNAAVTALRSEVAGLPEAALTHAPAGEWSTKDIVGHLLDHAQFLHRRLYMMIKLEEPLLEAYDQEALVRARNAQAASIGQLLAEFVAQRNETIDMLAGLVHWNWARTGRHEELGRISIRQLVDRAVAHDAAHLAQVRSLRERPLAARS